MFTRKLYYHNKSGVIVVSSMMQGNVHLTTLDEDIVRYPELQPYAQSPNDLGAMVWTEPDIAMEESFARATGISVDVTVIPHQIVFDYTPLPEPDPEPNEAIAEALAILRGEVAEEDDT